MEFFIHTDNLTKVKKIEFCKEHEKNLVILYEIIKNQVERKEKCSMEQLMVICCFHIVKEIRKKTSIENIQNMVIRELSENKRIMEILREIKSMLISIRIDAIPKTILEFSSENRCFVPSLEELPVLR